MNAQRICGLLLSGVLILTCSAFAKTLYVGTCQTSTYSTISAAVAAATPGSTIDVCPGTYAEQVFIYQQLTLQGITSSGGDLARIVVPTNPFGGTTNWQFVTDPVSSHQMAPQIFVNAPAGTVKITNLTIDGTGEQGNPACSVPGAWTTIGIYVLSSVNVDDATTIGQGANNGCGAGIWAQANPVINSVAITRSSVQNPSMWGIYLNAQATGAMPVSVTYNAVQMSPTPATAGQSAFASYGITGVISSNTIIVNNTGAFGILDGSTNGPLTISSNTLVGPGAAGIATDSGSPGATNVGPETYSDNTVVNFTAGIAVPVANNAVTVKNNSIVNSEVASVLNSCTGWTLSGNKINYAVYGFANAPSGFSATASQVSFYNVGQFVWSTFTCP